MREWIRGLTVPLGIGLGALILGACGGPPADPSPTQGIAANPTDRDRLAGLAAAAKDRRYVASYTLTSARTAAQTVTVAYGTDNSWLVAVPGGALGGLADIAIYSSRSGLYQCLLGPASGTAGARPDLGPLAPGCTAVTRLTSATDPRVEHLFTDWIDPLLDRATALSVAAAPLLSGARGACYSVESNSAALAPPVDPGIYCYATDGTLTGARVGFGTVILSGPVAPAPPSVTMPGPISHRAPLTMTAPPAPTSSPSAPVVKPSG